MKSIFDNKEEMPVTSDLKRALGKTFRLWEELESFTGKSYPGAKATWHFSGPKYGWSYRISDNKRVLIYLLPREQFFKVSMVFGAMATDVILKSNINEAIKTELGNAKVYAEGRGIRIDIKDDSLIADIKELILIKIGH